MLQETCENICLGTQRKPALPESAEFVKDFPYVQARQTENSFRVTSDIGFGAFVKTQQITQ